MSEREHGAAATTEDLANDNDADLDEMSQHAEGQKVPIDRD